MGPVVADKVCEVGFKVTVSVDDTDAKFMKDLGRHSTLTVWREAVEVAFRDNV